MYLQIEKKISFSQILPRGTLLNDYSEAPAGFSKFFQFGPDQEKERIENIDQQGFDHRKDLIAYLTSYHQALESPRETLQNIRALDDPETIVVMTGQQPGLLTGPIYTIYKTISCLKVAKRIQQTFHRPCIPVFWIASEDHDLEEATAIFLPDPKSREYKKLSICPKRGYFKQPVGLLPLSGKHIDRLRLELAECLGTNPYFKSINYLIEETLAKSSTLGEWFARLMLKLFGDYGLVLVEPNAARIKRLAIPLWSRVLSDPLALNRSVDQTGLELERCGYQRPLTVYPLRCPFFLYENHRRERVIWKGRLFHTENQAYSTEELYRILHSAPERFSPNVFLRPVFADYLFPTVLYPGGPGEIGYLAQIKGVYEYFGLSMPIILPRLSATLREDKVNIKPLSGSVSADSYLQERNLNIFYWLSQYGLEFLTALENINVESYFWHYQIGII